MSKETLETPKQKAEMPTLYFSVEPDSDFEVLATWWKPMTSYMASLAELRTYFETVETALFALGVDDEVEITGMKVSLARRFPNVKQVFSGPHFKEASEELEAMFQSPQRKPRAGGGAASNTKDDSVRERYYAYKDPLASMTITMLEIGSTLRATDGIDPERCHILDFKAAEHAGLDVKRTCFSFVDEPEKGLPVVPRDWPYRVANLVRKSAFANRRIVGTPDYPDDYSLDESRYHVTKLLRNKKVKKKTADALIKEHADDKEYALRVRQAQALRYAAQWARAILALQESGKLVLARQLIKALWLDTKKAIRDAESIMREMKQAGSYSDIADGIKLLVL
jgi:hypothetical protein